MKHNKQLKATDKIFTQVGAKRRGRIICNEEFSFDNFFNEQIASIRNDIIELEKVEQEVTYTLVTTKWYQATKRIHLKLIQSKIYQAMDKAEKSILAYDYMKMKSNRWIKKIVEDDLKLSK